MNRVECVVKDIVKLNESVFSVFLSSEQGFNDFKAGQYLDILIPGESSASFSIASSPNSKECIELNIGPVNKSYGSRVINYLSAASVVNIEFPKGKCFFDRVTFEKNKEILLLAGGTGFSQIFSIVNHLLENDVTNPIYIYWAVNDESLFYKIPMIEALVEKYSNITFIPAVKDVGVGEALWRGRSGLLPDIIMEDFDDFTDMEVIASGPVPMISALLDVCAPKGLTRNNLRSDVFEYAL